MNGASATALKSISTDLATAEGFGKGGHVILLGIVVGIRYGLIMDNTIHYSLSIMDIHYHLVYG